MPCGRCQRNNHTVLQQREAACRELAFVTVDESAWAAACCVGICLPRNTWTKSYSYKLDPGCASLYVYAENPVLFRRRADLPN